MSTLRTSSEAASSAPAPYWANKTSCPGDAQRLPQSIVAMVVAVMMGLGLLWRLAPVASDPLHPDECLYASWALSIADDSDPWLRVAALDKPPVYPYVLAAWSLVVGSEPASLRLCGVAAAACGLVSLYHLASTALGRHAAMPAVVLVAMSPVAVALDGSALTDPPAIAVALLAATAALHGRSVAAGVLFGLAVGTKPQLLAYAPLVAMLLPAPRQKSWARAAAGALAIVLAVAAWEATRAAPVTFTVAAARNYGLVGFRSPSLALASDWLALLRWVWGEPAAIALCAAVLVGALAVAATRRSRGVCTRLAVGAFASLILYLGGSLACSMPAWDRYALAALPPLGLLLAWAAHTLGEGLPRLSWLPAAALALALALLLWAPAQEAAWGRLPLGDTSRWAGIEDVTAYVRGQVPGRATILYRDLGWQVGYYMRRFPQDFRWVPDDPSLLAEARRAEPCYLLVAVDAEGESMLAVLREAGVEVRPAYVAYRVDGAASVALYSLAGAG